MTKYKYIYLIWLLPAYLLFLTVHQVSVYYGIADTYENGNSYTAEVIEFDIKQIASQTNGFVVLRFETRSGESVQQKLSLPVELAGMISELSQIPIRYQEGAFEDIVMMPTYRQHRSMTLSNAVMAFLGLLMALGVAWVSHRYAGRKLAGEEETLVIERVA